MVHDYQWLETENNHLKYIENQGLMFEPLCLVSNLMFVLMKYYLHQNQ